MSSSSRADRLDPGVVVSLCAIYLVTLGALVVPIFVGLSLRVLALRPDSWSPETSLSVVKAVGAAAALVANIGFGWLSDRTAFGRWGRVPWMLAGTVVGGLFVVLAGHTTSYSGLIVLWALAQLGYNACFAAVVGAIADLAPTGDRSRVSGWWGASATASVVISLGAVTYLSKTTFIFFDLMPVLSVPVVAAGAWWLVRHARAAEVVPRVALVRSRPAAEGWRAQFALLLSQAFLVQMAYNAATVYSVYYLIRRIAISADSAATWASATIAVAGVLGMAGAVGGARWARAMRRSDLPMGAGVVVVGAGLVVLTFGTGVWAYAVAISLAGIGSGIYGATDLGLVIRILPGATAGRYLGVFNVARTLPQSLVPSLAPLALAIGGGDIAGIDRSEDFAALFLLGILCALAGLASLAALRVRAADEQIPELAL